MEDARTSSIRAWLQLLRAPNLLTVPGDPLAGFFLAVAASPYGLHRQDWWVVPLACLTSLLLYAAGLIHNDIQDLREDRRERPTRPLASGAIPLRSAIVAFLACVTAALAAAWAAGTSVLVVAAAVLAAAMMYNAFLKRLPVVGPLTMGLCRGLSVLVGAAVVVGVDQVRADWQGVAQAHLPALLAAATTAAYVAALSAIARGETREQTVSLRAYLPAAALVAGFGCLYVEAYARLSVNTWLPAVVLLLPVMCSALFAVTAVALAVQVAIVLRRGAEPARAQRSVGVLVRALCRVQAAQAALVLPWGLLAAAGLLAAWYAAEVLSRKFYSS
jgi:4-hydroxybenzoate polyprenyltransferase